MDDRDKFFNIVGDLFDLFNVRINGNYLLLKPLNLLDPLLDVRLGYLFELVLLLYVDLLLQLRDDLRFSL